MGTEVGTGTRTGVVLRAGAGRDSGGDGAREGDGAGDRAGNGMGTGLGTGASRAVTALSPGVPWRQARVLCGPGDALQLLQHLPRRDPHLREDAPADGRGGAVPGQRALDRPHHEPVSSRRQDRARGGSGGGPRGVPVYVWGAHSRVRVHDSRRCAGAASAALAHARRGAQARASSGRAPGDQINLINFAVEIVSS